MGRVRGAPTRLVGVSDEQTEVGQWRAVEDVLRNLHAVSVDREDGRVVIDVEDRHRDGGDGACQRVVADVRRVNHLLRLRTPSQLSTPPSQLSARGEGEW